MLQTTSNRDSESLKSPDFTVVPVQVRPRAPKSFLLKFIIERLLSTYSRGNVLRYI